MVKILVALSILISSGASPATKKVARTSRSGASHSSAYRKGLGTCDALSCYSHTLQSALESGQEDWIVQIDFSAAFDRVNYQGILYKLCSLDTVGFELSLLTQFLSNRSQHVMVYSCRSKLVNVWSGAQQGSVLGRYCSSCTPQNFFHSGE